MIRFTTLLLLLAAAGARGQTGDLKAVVKDMAHQMMLDEWNLQQVVRTQGQSGIKQVRHQRDGTRPYHSDTHTGSGVASIHEHGDTRYSMGMGEVCVVLNGVNFCTRHNDYLPKMPHRTSKDYHATEDVPFPAVPPSVLQKTSVKDQIDEMQQYFKAWKEQDASIRDYEPYFKPVLSYMEGAWTFPDSDALEEPYEGERHQVWANTWSELEQKTLFTSYTGSKDGLENLAYLPRAVVNVSDDGMPQFAQWNYRILCHPLKRDYLLPDRLRVVDDLATRMSSGKTLEEFAKTKEARFTLNPTDSADLKDGRYDIRLLDQVMREVPGWDNYQGEIYDEAFGATAYKPESLQDEKLNVAYYSHVSKHVVVDAMGMGMRHRGDADEGLFMAMTTQPKVAGRSYSCDWQSNKAGCTDYEQRWTYAIPLEIFYMTPLAEWNPYNIEYHGKGHTETAKKVTADGRDGSEDKPYDGTHSARFFRTPIEFFDGDEVDTRGADTTGGAVWVLDGNGEKHQVRASGHRIIIPSVGGGVGELRQRYPIMPVHGEGDTVWKELDALKDIVLNPAAFSHMLDSGNMAFMTGPAKAEYYSHKHSIVLSAAQRDVLADSKRVTVTSSRDSGHAHVMEIEAVKGEQDSYKIKVVKCDGAAKCKDGHDEYLSSGGFTDEWTYVTDVAAWIEQKKKEEKEKKESSSSSGRRLSAPWATLSLVVLGAVAHRLV